jgi:Raf kinase inhibitor-like YbhB/YbcL family protein
VTLPAVAAAAFALTSPVFAPGHVIPSRYTCDGADVSPALRWTAPPRGTRSLTLRVTDLDTRPRFLHWYVTGIGIGVRALTAGTHVGRRHGNDFGGTGYGGPCPPTGRTHHYLFELRALGRGGRTLADARLVGTYRRR